jgi:hypothetical protein
MPLLLCSLSFVWISLCRSLFLWPAGETPMRLCGRGGGRLSLPRLSGLSPSGSGSAPASSQHAPPTLPPCTARSPPTPPRATSLSNKQHPSVPSCCVAHRAPCFSLNNFTRRCRCDDHHHSPPPPQHNSDLQPWREEQHHQQRIAFEGRLPFPRLFPCPLQRLRRRSSCCAARWATPSPLLFRRRGRCCCAVA